jgi:hypothetical protein
MSVFLGKIVFMRAFVQDHHNYYFLKFMLLASTAPLILTTVLFLRDLIANKRKNNKKA